MSHGKVRIEHLGTVKSDLIGIQDGPDISELLHACFYDGEVTFKLEEPLGKKMGPFSNLKELKVRKIGVCNMGSYYPTAHRGHKDNKDGWMIKFWIFDQQENDIPYIRFKGYYYTGIRQGNLDEVKLMLQSIDELVNLPGFRWRKDLTRILQVEKIILKEKTSFMSSVSGSGGKEVCEGIDAGEYKATLAMEGNVPNIFISSKFIGRTNARIPLSDAVKNPCIEIVWKR